MNTETGDGLEWHRAWLARPGNGDAPCTCGHPYARHYADLNGCSWCHEFEPVHLRCAGFNIDRSVVSVGKSAEQRARDLLERYGVEDAQSMTAGDLVELANLIADANVRCPECERPGVWVVYENVEFEGSTILAAFDSGAVAERFAEQHRMARRYVPSDLVYTIAKVVINHPAEEVRQSYLNQAGWLRGSADV